MNIKIRNGSLIQIDPPHAVLAEFKTGYEMQSIYTDPATGISYDKIELIFDNNGPFEELDSTRPHKSKFVLDGVEKYPGALFHRSSISYNPGLGEDLMRLADKYGTFDPRVFKRLSKINFVYTYQAFRVRLSAYGLPPTPEVL